MKGDSENVNDNDNDNDNTLASFILSHSNRSNKHKYER